jgi:hypothetical protein
MNLAEWIAFGGLVIAIIGLYVEVIRLRRESKNHQKAMKVMIDYISIQKEAIETLEKAFTQNNQTALSALQLQNEQISWNKFIAAAKTLGWLYDREII